MSHAMQRFAVVVIAAAAVLTMSVAADAQSKQSRQTRAHALDAHAQQYPNWNRVTSAPRGRACIGTCSRYNLPPGPGVNYLDGNGAGYYGGG